MIIAAFLFILVVAVALWIKKLNDQKKTKEQDALKLKIPVVKVLLTKLENEASEKDINSVQTLHLMAELASRKRELANAALSLVYKNEVLQKLSAEISLLKAQKSNSLSEIEYRKLQHIIEQGMNDERDWHIYTIV